jgi:hypothetical protein
MLQDTYPRHFAFQSPPFSIFMTFVEFSGPIKVAISGFHCFIQDQPVPDNLSRVPRTPLPKFMYLP